MPKRTEKRAKVSDMVLWAKDRLLDDLQDRIDEFQNSASETIDTNYAVSKKGRRNKINKDVMKLATLLNLPDDSYDSLAALRKAGYWNGAKDTWWEDAPQPPLGYKGQ